jgi:hypothetical protein
MNIFDQLLGELRLIRQHIQTMPTRQDLDDALTALLSSFSDLTNALTTLATAIANLPQQGNPDFTAEIGQVQQAAADVAAAQASVTSDITALNPPPPPAPQP